jgi:hypothetical protein
MKLCDLTDLSSVFAIIDLSCSVVLNWMQIKIHHELDIFMQLHHRDLPPFVLRVPSYGVFKKPQLSFILSYIVIYYWIVVVIVSVLLYYYWYRLLLYCHIINSVSLYHYYYYYIIIILLLYYYINIMY